MNLDHYLIDTHCHLTDLSDLEVLTTLERARAKNVKKVICVGASKGKQSNLRAFQLLNLSNDILISIGIHPHDADNTSWDEDLLKIASDKRVVAIGETGLDYFKNWSDFSKQKELFIESIKVAKTLKKPLIIHCRDALEDTLNLLKTYEAEEVGGVFHCYSGSKETADILAHINFKVSYTGILTFKNSTDAKEGARHIPLEQIMLETDAPYMAPEPYRGKISEPAYVHEIAKYLAELKGITIENVTEITTSNARALFKLS
jgi:TatD DNase family protein